jgi:spore maturation protein CgeB
MKLFLPKISWEGDLGKYFFDSMKANNVNVINNTNTFHRNPLIKIAGLRDFNTIRLKEWKYYAKRYGEKLLKQCVEAKPDVFFVFNESKLSPDIIQKIKEKCKCLMVLALGDDPWDSIRWQCDFPHSLKYFDIIFSADPSWNNNIRKVAPKAKIYWHFGGYDENRFRPVDTESYHQKDIERFTCDLAFTGSSYANKAEGAYRADILSYLTNYDLKIWGGDNWEYRFKFNPHLQSHYFGQKLKFDELRKLYASAKIFLNLPAPQVVLSFQPRIFEIAGCKGFQIADNRRLLRYLFTDDELVVFNTIDDLIEKIDYYLSHEKERYRLMENLHNRVARQYTWKHWAGRIVDVINSGKGIKDLDIKLENSDPSELKEVLRNA